MGKKSFVTGALILMTANAVSKILGAVFKIPLTYILAEEGMAVYNTAFQVYIMFLSFIISGFPLAVSKAVAEAEALKKPSRSRRIVSVSALLLSAIGLAGSLLLYFLAPYLAAAMKESAAQTAIRIIAPSVFFVALGTAYKSYFQGVSDMVPVAVSQVVEAVIKLVVGYGLAVYCVKFGTAATSAGAVGGVTVGEALATLLLIAGYLRVKKERTPEKDDGEIIKPLFAVAVPLLAAAAASNALSIAETALIRNSLLYSGLAEDEARFLYGAYTGYAQTVFHLPAGILATIGVSILPVIAGAAVNGDFTRARRVTNFAMKLVMSLALPCAVVMYMLPELLLNSLFKNASSALMLKILAPCIVPLCLTQLMVSVMQSAGKIGAPFAAAVCCSLARLILCRVLAASPELNIYGAVISAAAGMFLSVVPQYALVKRFLCLKLDIMEIIIKPAVAAAVMAGVIYLARDPVTARLGTGFTALAALGALSCAAYFTALALTGGVSVKEIRKNYGRV